MSRFAGKVIMITGSGRGIGQSIALKFASEGATVAGVGIGSQIETAERIDAVGGRYIGLKADLGTMTRAEAGALVAEVVAKAGRIDGLVNNAGIIRRAPAVEHPEADWNAVLHINLTVPFFLSQAAAKWWLDEGRAKSPQDARLKIVNIASMLSFQGGILVPSYTASKSGIAGITRALACEWAQERINVNAVAPGYIATEATRQIRENAVRDKAILDRIPEGRWGNPDDIAGGCAYLSSADADYINGAILNIDGGWLSR